MRSTCRMCWRPWVWARSRPRVVFLVEKTSEKLWGVFLEVLYGSILIFSLAWLVKFLIYSGVEVDSCSLKFDLWWCFWLPMISMQSNCFFDKFRSARQSWWFEGPAYDFFCRRIRSKDWAMGTCRFTVGRESTAQEALAVWLRACQNIVETTVIW